MCGVQFTPVYYMPTDARFFKWDRKKKKYRSTYGVLVSVGALYPQSCNSDTLPEKDGVLRVERERRLCGLCVSQSPHSICMHSSSSVCACCLPVPLISKHLLIRALAFLSASTQTQTCRPNCFPSSNVSRIVLRKRRSLRSLTHLSCVGLVAGPLSHC